MNNHTLSSLIGGALGDALGYGREFDSLDKITTHLPNGDWRHANYTNAPHNPTDQNNNTLISDDTQMTIATGRALLASQTMPGGPAPQPPAVYAYDLSQHYVAWSKHPDNNRAPGGTCMRACYKLGLGMHWSDATDLSSMGCGANMRVAPIALSHNLYVSPDHLAYLSSAITHAHPAALAAAQLTVAAITAVYDGMDGTETLDFLIEECIREHDYPHHVLGDLWEQSEYTSPGAYLRAGYLECVDNLRAARTAIHLGWTGDTDPCEITGQAWTAPEALAGAMLCVAGLWDNPVQVIQRAAVSNGDSDSVAAIAGNIIGAKGVEWPAEWVGMLETGPVNELIMIADQL